MNALVRKELRQVLPAHLLLTAIATIAWFSIVDADRALAPYDSGQGSFHFAIALFALVQGLVLGAGQFGSERWLGTEAYLVHRGTGRAGAFRAKVVAACASLAMLVIVPPLAYGAFHLALHPYAGPASVARLAQAAAAACVAFAGYALGVYVSQIRRGVLASVVMALVGGFGVLLIVIVAVLPTADEPPTWTRFALVLLGVVAALLGSARWSFLERRAAQGASARCAGVLQVVVALALVLPAFLFALSAAQAAFLIRWEGGSSHVVEDAEGELYVATPTDVDRKSLRATIPDVHPYGRVYELVDSRGVRVPVEQAVAYTGFGDTTGPFVSIYAPFMVSNGPIERPDPRQEWTPADAAFVLGGRWYLGSQGDLDWRLEAGSGALWTRNSERDSSWIGHPRRKPAHAWQLVTEMRPGVRPLRSVSRSGNSQAVFLDESAGRIQRLVEGSDGAPSVVEAPLPDGERFVGLESLIDARSARIGYRGIAVGELVLGERNAYVWNGGSWVAWDSTAGSERMGLVAPNEAAGLQDWRLDFDYEGGRVERLTIRDARTGATSLTLDLRPPSSTRRVSHALALLSCVGLPPAASAFAWWGVERSDASPLSLRVDLLSPDGFGGRKNVWIAVARVLLGIAMVRDLWRRLESGAPIELRLAWCLATALLGLSAYFACRLLEPRSARAPRAEARTERRIPQFEIRTA